MEKETPNNATLLAFISRGRNQNRGRNPTGLRDKPYVMGGNFVQMDGSCSHEILHCPERTFWALHSHLSYIQVIALVHAKTHDVRTKAHRDRGILTL